MESRLSGLSRASVKFCMPGRSCRRGSDTIFGILFGHAGGLSRWGPHPTAPMSLASCRRLAGSGTSAALRQRPARAIREKRARNELLVAGKVARQRADLSEQFLFCPVVSSAGRPVADSMRIVADADESAERRGGFGRSCFADGRFPLVVRACEKVGRSPARFVRGRFFDLPDQKPEQFAQGGGQAFRNVFFADAGLCVLPPRCMPIVGRESRDDAVSLLSFSNEKAYSSVKNGSETYLASGFSEKPSKSSANTLS